MPVYFISVYHISVLTCPLPYALVIDDDAAYGQDLLGHVQAERNAAIQPNGVADDLCRKVVADTAGAKGLRRPCRPPILLPILKPSRSQVDSTYAGPNSSVRIASERELHRDTGMCYSVCDQPHDLIRELT